MSRTTVLIVEDEATVRLVGADTAAEAGYEVLEAASADEALKILEGAENIHILFSDIRMPGSMNGFQLARLVHDRWPSIKILLTSGDMLPGRGDIPDDGHFIAKPYKLATLQRELSDLQPSGAGN